MHQAGIYPLLSISQRDLRRGWELRGWQIEHRKSENISFKLFLCWVVNKMQIKDNVLLQKGWTILLILKLFLLNIIHTSYGE